MTLPAEVQSIRALVSTEEHPRKGRIIEAIRRYAAFLPPDSWRFNETDSKAVTFLPGSWSRLYVQTLATGEVMLLDYRLGTAWLYRGEVMVARDLFGPNSITIHDRLLFAYPIFSLKTLDAAS